MENDQLVIAPERIPRQGWNDAFAAGDSSPFEGMTNKFDKGEWSW
jgi:hypothetical protein